MLRAAFLCAANYNQGQTFDGHQSVGIGVFQLPGTNALDVADRVRRQDGKELKAQFPDGLDYQIAYDTTPFIRESIADVVSTLFEAVVLVAIVVLAFLQNWRAAVIPLVAVPVAIVGTFAVMANELALHYSLNNISLFGLVLAIGIVVDDAIVVVENVERWMEHGLDPRDAARKAMDEVTGPVVAVASCSARSSYRALHRGDHGAVLPAVCRHDRGLHRVLGAQLPDTSAPRSPPSFLKPRGTTHDPLTWLLDPAARLVLPPLSTWRSAPAPKPTRGW